MPVRDQPTVPDVSNLMVDEGARTAGGPQMAALGRCRGWCVAPAVGRGFLADQPGSRGPARNRAHGWRRYQVALLNASGYVTPRRRATIAAKITGRITQMFDEEGMRARAGQVLATLDQSDARVRLTSAQADRDATSAALADLGQPRQRGARTSSHTGVGNPESAARRRWILRALRWRAIARASLRRKSKWRQRKPASKWRSKISTTARTAYGFAPTGSG